MYIFTKTLDAHSSPITALDFSEPYGALVSASQEDSQPRVWDLFSATETGRLQGHRGAVKCIQVEDHVCLTGGEDGNVRLWDLRRVDDDGEWYVVVGAVFLGDLADVDKTLGKEEDGAELRSKGIRSSEGAEQDDPCARILEGHSKAVTALYFEDECLVSCVVFRTASIFLIQLPR
jgi:division protein 1